MKYSIVLWLFCISKAFAYNDVFINGDSIEVKKIDGVYCKYSLKSLSAEGATDIQMGNAFYHMQSGNIIPFRLNTPDGYKKFQLQQYNGIVSSGNQLKNPDKNDYKKKFILSKPISFRCQKCGKAKLGKYYYIPKTPHSLCSPCYITITR